MVRRFLFYGVLLLLPVAALTVAQPPQRYCAPLVFRDRQVVAGYEAIVRVRPGCQKPAYVRKFSPLTGSVIGEPSIIKAGEVKRVWLFTHRLQYTLDGKNWKRAAVQ